MPSPAPPISRPISRRDALRRAACGFGWLAWTGLATSQTTPPSLSTLTTTHGIPPHPAPLPPGLPPGCHHRPRARRVIFLFMQGGPSQVDTYDYKPDLDTYHGTQMPFDDARTIANTGNRGTGQRVLRSPWAFSRQGQCGQWVSELFPHTARHVDDLCFIRSLQTEGVAHGPATLFLHCGATTAVRPSMGAWISYGLGTENRNLPAFVTIAPSLGNGGSRNWSSAFLPPRYQGTPLGSAGQPAASLAFRNLDNPRLSPAQQRRQFELIRHLNHTQAAQQAPDPRIEAALESYELAWRMQREAPSTLDLAHESPATLALYGIGESPTDEFGRQCLLARRLCEAGVRFIQVTYGDNTANPRWDQHSDLPKHAVHARATDRPVAGLLADLKQRGLLDDTLVWWGAEFGRTPYAEKDGTGRDHNPGGFTAWLAGGGVKTGLAYGATDAFGHLAVQDPVHLHDLHATVLHLLGLDHERLTYRFDGRDHRLTDVAGRVIMPLLG